MYSRANIIHLVKRRGVTVFLIDVLQGRRQTYICPFAIHRHLIAKLELTPTQEGPRKLFRIEVSCLHYPHSSCGCTPSVHHSDLYEPGEFGLEEDFEF